MPIYEYRCKSCGFQKEFLRKMSDPALSDCPACGKATLGKLVTAAGFHLKGTGWYVTDFKGGAKPKDANEPNKDAGVEAKPATTPAAESKSGESPKSEGSKSGESRKSEESKSGESRKSEESKSGESRKSPDSAAAST